MNNKEWKINDAFALWILKDEDGYRLVKCANTHYRNYCIKFDGYKRKGES